MKFPLLFISFLLFFAAHMSAQEALPDLALSPVKVTAVKSKYSYDRDAGKGLFCLIPGDEVTFGFGIKNKGQTSSGNFAVEVILYSDGKPTQVYKRYRKDFGVLSPGLEFRFEDKVAIKSVSGDLSCVAQVIDMEKADWNYDNNHTDSGGSFIIWKKEYVADYLRPDLAVQISSPDASRRLRRTVRLDVKVTNKGNRTSIPSLIRLKCKDKKTKEKSVPSLKPGESFSHQFQHKWSLLGKKTCTATVDPDDKISELDGRNNKASMKVTIK
jgi:hypothetical protein